MYEPLSEFERLVLEKLARVEVMAQAATNAAVAARDEVGVLREETKILADAASGARLAAEEAERRAVAAELRSEANCHYERHERPTDPDLSRHSSTPPNGNADA